MKTIGNIKTVLSLAGISLLWICCAKQPVAEVPVSENSLLKTGAFRSYQEAEAFALDAIGMMDQSADTRSGKSRTIASGVCYSKPATKSEPAADSLFYVFNFSDDAGFAIIAGNRRISPIIAVTEQGTYHPGEKTGVEGFDDYMDKVVSEFSGIDRGDPLPYSYYEDEIVGTQMPPLVSVRWGKTGVYGQYCPNGISGCVMTANAQVLSYLEKPDSLVLSVNMGNDYTAGDTLVLNWPLIKEHIVNHSDSLACNAVHKQIGALMRELGVRHNAYYGPSYTSAFLFDSVNVLSLLGIQCSNFVSANISTIRQSLLMARPVLLGGGDITNRVAHAFVADGYRDYEVWRTTYICQGENGGYIPVGTTKISESHALHINWGWDGVCNGYFTFGTYNTAYAEEYDTDINNESYDFCDDVFMITDIKNPGLTPLPL